MNGNVLPIVIAACFWLYAMYCFFMSREVVSICKGRHAGAYILIFTVLAVLLLIRDRGFVSLLCCLAIVLSGLFLSAVPCGYNDKEVILLGKKVPLEKIGEVRREEDEREVRLLLESGGRIYILHADKEERREIDDLYYKLKKGREERI